MKIRLLYIGFLTFLLSGSSAQQSAAFAIIESDSLELLLIEHSAEDEEHIRILNDYARACFKALLFQKGLEATREARLISEKIGFDGGQVMYYETLAAYHGSGSLEEYYQKKAETLSKSEHLDLGKYFINLDRVRYNLGSDYESLLSRETRIYRYFEGLGDVEIQANVLRKMAYFNYELGNYEESLRLQDRVIDLFNELQYVYPVFLISTEKNYNFQELNNEEEIEKNQADLIEFVTQNENSHAYGMILADMAASYAAAGRRAIAIEYYLKSIAVYEKTDEIDMLIMNYSRLCDAYNNLERYDKSAEVYDEIIALSMSDEDTSNLYATYNRAAMSNYFIKDYDKARDYMTLSLQEKKESTHLYYKARQNSLEGQILKDRGQYTSAIGYFERASATYQELNRVNSLPFMYMYIAECYQLLGDYPKALSNALEAVQKENETTTSRTKVESRLSLMLSEIYEALGQRDKSYQYLKRYQEIRARKDQLDIENRLADIQVKEIIQQSQLKIEAAEQERLLAAQESKTQRLWNFGISGALLSALFLSLFLYRNNQSKQKANRILREQKEQIQTTLSQLKSTQTQLIHSEKMASLGELTAGIAHEIQNPLNFVNNFSDVSGELIDEAIEELTSQTLTSAPLSDQGRDNLTEATDILNDLKGNLEKISHHGERASSIVRGMLAHSRESSNEKVPTDINALCDEYIRLSYHGLRAKDKTFNAEFELDLDEHLPKIDVIPQDIGRVLLNIFNNAFYAVDQKSKKGLYKSANPAVTIKTQPMSLFGGMSGLSPRGENAEAEKGVTITITDNGTGMSQATIDKVFQPFFTTKPTGEGTGLGMSISYDIVTKGHGGELKVESPPSGEPNGEGGTRFIITLPYVNMAES